VKCDEGKPSCTRCTSTGRKCDGYTTPVQSPQSSQSPESNEIVRSPERSPLSSALSGLRLESSEEREAFHFFQYRGASELSGFFDSRFWQFDIPQASHYNPGIRHAVVALASMYRKLIAGGVPVVPDDASDKHLRFALEQSNRAISEVVKIPGHKTIADKLNMMTTCILFHCLSCIQGHQTMAFRHLRSGLRLLREVEEELETGTRNPNNYPVSFDTLRAILVNMDVQARGIMSDAMVALWEPQPKRNPAIHQDPFRTFIQARFCFESTFNDLITLATKLDDYPPKSEEKIKEVSLDYERIQRQFNAGSIRLDTFLSQFSNTASELDTNSVIGIRLIHNQVRVFLKAFSQFGCLMQVKEVDWAIEDDDMEAILDLASQLLGAPRDLTLLPGTAPEDYCTSSVGGSYTANANTPFFATPVFSSCSGLLSALWVFTSRTRSFALRRKAIALLLYYPRREGVWDSIIAGRIAWEQMRLEEEALERGQSVFFEQTGPIMLDWWRIRNIIIEYPGLRCAQVEYKNIQQHETGESGVVSHFSW
jgi:hypothetical protein